MFCEMKLWALYIVSNLVTVFLDEDILHYSSATINYIYTYELKHSLKSHSKIKKEVFTQHYLLLYKLGNKLS